MRDDDDCVLTPEEEQLADQIDTIIDGYPPPPEPRNGNKAQRLDWLRKVLPLPPRGIRAMAPLLYPKGYAGEKKLFRDLQELPASLAYGWAFEYRDVFDLPEHEVAA